jgi:hypothetical protein
MFVLMVQAGPPAGSSTYQSKVTGPVLSVVVRPSRRLSVEPLVGVNARTPLVELSGAFGVFVLCSSLRSNIHFKST